MEELFVRLYNLMLHDRYYRISIPKSIISYDTLDNVLTLFGDVRIYPIYFDWWDGEPVDGIVFMHMDQYSSGSPTIEIFQ